MVDDLLSDLNPDDHINVDVDHPDFQRPESALAQFPRTTVNLWTHPELARQNGTRIIFSRLELNKPRPHGGATKGGQQRGIREFP
jgi:hypothetical protein